MSTVIASSTLVNGLRTEFVDTYMSIRNRQMDDHLALVMDLGVQATNRQHDFAYFESAPHMAHWERGKTIPTGAMDSVKFNVPIYEWARRIPWLKWDRKDDQTQSLMDVARMAGQSAALLPEQFFIDCMLNNAGTLPAVPNAPDGVAMFNATHSDGTDRFGISGGNIITATGLTAAGIITDFYALITRWMNMQDTQGQPLFNKSMLDGGFVIVHPPELTNAMETAFRQKLHIGATTADGGGAGSGSNLPADVGRNVVLWGTPRLTDNDDWYCFLKSPPKQATFFLDREGVQEFSSIEGGEGDHTRNTAEEYIQWESRSGAGIALPYAAIKVNTA